MRPFLRELPRHYGRSPQDAELQRALEGMAAQAEADKNFTLEQLFPSTASGWGLALWEEAYGLTREPGQTEERRRARIMAKVQGTGVTTPERVRGIVRTMLGLDSTVEEHWARYAFSVTVEDIPLDRAARLRDLWEQIALLKPAHLDFWLTGRFQPIPLANTPGSFRFQSLRLASRVRSYGWDVIRLDGARPLDGSWALDQQFRGMGWRRVCFSVPIREWAASSGAAAGCFGAAVSRLGAELAVQVKAAVRERPGAPRPRRIACRAAVRPEYGLSGTLTRDTMWTLDGAFRLDGRKKLNAAIIKEEI